MTPGMQVMPGIIATACRDIIKHYRGYPMGDEEAGTLQDLFSETPLPQDEGKG